MCHYIACILLFTLVFCHFMFLPVWRINLIIIVTIAQHYGFVANLVLNPAVKEFRKSVNISNSYCLTNNSSRFFETQCTNKWKRFVCPFWAFDEQWMQFNERSKLVTVNSSRAKKTWRWTRHRREKNDSELVTENSLWRVHRVTSSLVTAHCTAHHRSRDPSTTGSESSMYWSWVVTCKKNVWSSKKNWETRLS